MVDLVLVVVKSFVRFILLYLCATRLLLLISPINFSRSVYEILHSPHLLPTSNSVIFIRKPFNISALITSVF